MTNIDVRKRRLCIDQINFETIGLEITNDPDDDREIEYIEINSLNFHKIFGFTPEEGLVLHVEVRDGTDEARLEIQELQRKVLGRQRDGQIR